MFKSKIQKIKEDFLKKDDSKKTIENLVVFVIILIVTVIFINFIWSDNKNSATNQSEAGKILASSNDSLNEIEESSNNLEERLEKVISKISGVGEVDILITYSETSQTIPVYNENYEESITEEEDTQGGTRKVETNNTKKEVVYQESNGSNVPITQSVVSPKIEGAIIIAEGASNSVIKNNIIEAVGAVTGLATHKIQVFEMN